MDIGKRYNIAAWRTSSLLLPFFTNSIIRTQLCAIPPSHLRFAVGPGSLPSSPEILLCCRYNSRGDAARFSASHTLAEKRAHRIPTAEWLRSAQPAEQLLSAPIGCRDLVENIATGEGSIDSPRNVLCLCVRVPMIPRCSLLALSHVSFTVLVPAVLRTDDADARGKHPAEA